MATPAPPQTISVTTTEWGPYPGNPYGGSHSVVKVIPNPAYAAWSAANVKEAALIARLQSSAGQAGFYQSQVWGPGTQTSGVRQLVIDGKTYWYTYTNPDGTVSTGGSRGFARTTLKPYTTFVYTVPTPGFNQTSPGGGSPTMTQTGHIYTSDPFPDLSTYQPGKGSDILMESIRIVSIMLPAIGAVTGVVGSAASAGGSVSEAATVGGNTFYAPVEAGVEASAAPIGSSSSGLGGGSGTVGQQFGNQGTLGSGLGGGGNLANVTPTITQSNILSAGGVGDSTGVEISANTITQDSVVTTGHATSGTSTSLAEQIPGYIGKAAAGAAASAGIGAITKAVGGGTKASGSPMPSEYQPAVYRVTQPGSFNWFPVVLAALGLLAVVIWRA